MVCFLLFLAIPRQLILNDHTESHTFVLMTQFDSIHGRDVTSFQFADKATGERLSFQPSKVIYEGESVQVFGSDVNWYLKGKPRKVIKKAWFKYKTGRIWMKPFQREDQSIEEPVK